LEYSILIDAAYCLYCYLFKPDIGKQAGGDSFVTKGFSNWKKKEKIEGHVGAHNCAHNQARRKCEALLNHKQSIIIFFDKQSDQHKIVYKTCLNASVDCVHFLQQQELVFRGHDESKGSSNQENFLELLQFLAKHNEEIDKVVLENAPENNQMIVGAIQKDIANAAASKTLDVILKDLDELSFAIIVDESRDISIKEQLAIVLHYIDKRGHVIERCLGIAHVSNTTAVTPDKFIRMT
jgi:putative heme iron utilization protein